MAEGILEISESNFESEVKNSDVPVMLDFWAPWCGPCQAVTPIMEQLAQDFAGKAKVGKVNVDNNQSLAASFGISSIPAVYLFKGGEVVATQIGAAPKDVYEQMIEEHL